MNTSAEVSNDYARSFPLESIKKTFSSMNASEVAELFLSPFVDAELLNLATAEEGPSLWIVNRSDVYDETLEALCSHPLAAISSRAKEKLGLRKSKLIFLSPPEVPESLEDTPDYMIEDLLGHPLVPLQIPLHFSHHLLEDFRSSAALSLTRRLLEHAPNWNFDLSLKFKTLETFFARLLQDPSPMVRSYCARIPLFESSQIAEAFAIEKNDFVRGRLLQNPTTPQNLAPQIKISPSDALKETLFLGRVAALDKRVPQNIRRAQLLEISNDSADPLCLAIHSWYLSKLN